jgi:alpha-tubulin suppressor-like RCC1 family protein
MLASRRVPLGVLAGVLAAAGCNAIFGIEPGTPRGETGGAGGAGGAATTSGPTTSGPTTTGPTTTGPTTTGPTTTTGSGGSDGGTPCTKSTCTGAVLEVCKNGLTEPSVTCDAVAACDAAAGVCNDAGGLRRLAVSLGRACAIDDQRAVRCWGQNTYGVLFLGDPHDMQPSATLIDGSAGARQLALAEDHGCYLEDSGQVACWGGNDNGALGTSPGEPQAPGEVPGLSGVVEVAVKEDCSCARLTDGTVECWGLQDHGCLGTASQVTGPQPVPTALPGVSKAVQLSMGYDEQPSCARLADLTVVCWNDSIVPTPVPGANGVLEITTGWGLVFMRTAAGVLTSAPKMDNSGWTGATPYGVSGALTQMSGGSSFCGLETGGAVTCGILDGSPNPPTLALLPGQPGGMVAEIAGGDGDGYETALTCLRIAGPSIAGNVWCWGDDEAGALGAGGPDLYPKYTDVMTAGPVASVRGSVWSTEVVLGTGAVQYWGNSALVDAPIAPSPTSIPLLGTDNALVQSNDIAGLAYVLKTSGPPVYFQSGSAVLNQGLPLSGFTDFADAHPFLHFDIGLRKSGGLEVYTQQGDGNMYGVFGDGTTTSMMGEVEAVPAIGNAQAVAAYMDAYNPGPAHVCAILGTNGSGTISCWGENNWGELGIGGMPMDGLTVSTPTAVALPGNEAAVSVAAGRYFTCAVTTSGKVYCWGANDVGQLGSTPGDPSPVPSLVATLPGPAAGVTAMEDFACAWLADAGKTAACWGNNDRRQLGGGTFDPEPEPVAVVGLQNVAEVSAGVGDACARRTDGTLACWGSSHDGQIGKGVMGVFAKPQQVMGL